MNADEVRALLALANAALLAHERAEQRPSRKTEMAAFNGREALSEAATPAAVAALCKRVLEMEAALASLSPPLVRGAAWPVGDN